MTDFVYQLRRLSAGLIVCGIRFTASDRQVPTLSPDRSSNLSPSGRAVFGAPGANQTAEMKGTLILMSNPLSYDEVHAIVREELAEVLGIETDEVTTAPMSDQGVESLDIVELRRNLESKFRVTFPRSNVLSALADELGGKDRVYDAEGRITKLAESALYQSAFGYTAADFQAGAWPHEVSGATTTVHWASMAHRLLNPSAGQISGDELLVADVREALAQANSVVA
jgi:acyl carrier protein